MADYPEPVPGLVIRYSYLWKREADRGDADGGKDRPCVVITAVIKVGERTQVLVAPITHTPPENPDAAIELNANTRRRLGLDQDKNWVIASELNQFNWPGPDLRKTPTGGYVYGLIPNVVFEDLKIKILACNAKSVSRTE